MSNVFKKGPYADEGCTESTHHKATQFIRTTAPCIGFPSLAYLVVPYRYLLYTLSQTLNTHIMCKYKLHIYIYTHIYIYIYIYTYIHIYARTCLHHCCRLCIFSNRSKFGSLESDGCSPKFQDRDNWGHGAHPLNFKLDRFARRQALIASSDGKTMTVRTGEKQDQCQTTPKKNKKILPLKPAFERWACASNACRINSGLRIWPTRRRFDIVSAWQTPAMNPAKHQFQSLRISVQAPTKANAFQCYIGKDTTIRITMIPPMTMNYGEKN